MTHGSLCSTMRTWWGAFFIHIVHVVWLEIVLLQDSTDLLK